MKGKKDPFDDYTAPIKKSSDSYSDEDDCSNITFPTTLENQTENLEKLNVGDPLEIRLMVNNILEAYSSNNENCGNIVSIYSGRIISCIGKNKKFSARLIDATGRVIVTCS